MKTKQAITYSAVLFIVFGAAIWIFFDRNKCSAMNKNDNVQEVISRRTLFIQGVTDISVLTSIKSELTLAINKIIKEELGLNLDYNFDFFLPKNWQRLTLYYLNDTDNEGVCLIDSAIQGILQENEKSFVLQNVKLVSQVNFFGDHKDELVLMIDDPSKELSLLNQRIKITMHEANKKHMCKYNSELYDISHSEKFSYLPHIGLGRIRSTSIKQHIKDASQVDKIYAQITRRILDEASLIVKELLGKNNIKLVFKTLCIFDLELRTCTKEYPLS